MDGVTMLTTGSATGDVASLAVAAVALIRRVVPERWLPSDVLPALAATVGVALTYLMLHATGQDLTHMIVAGIYNGLAATGLHQMTGMKTPDVSAEKN